MECDGFYGNHHLFLPHPKDSQLGGVRFKVTNKMEQETKKDIRAMGLGYLGASILFALSIHGVIIL